MARCRVSTTVDGDLLQDARRLGIGTTDAALFDEALRALLRQQRGVERDAAYQAYEKHPLDEPDEWGNLSDWLDAAART
jgi:antitoxin MazE5